MSSRLALLIQTLRPAQWVKNLLLFAPLLFTQRYRNLSDFLLVLLGALLWSFISSASYLINDWVDKEKDLKHPRKSQRPYTSGKISSGEMLFTLIILLTLGFSFAFSLNREFFLVMLIYFFLSVGYSVQGQKWAILEIFLVAFGYVLRVAGGAVILNVSISPWILLCSFCLSLTLVLGKRRAELLYGGNTRTVLAHYSPALIDQWLLISASSGILAYSFYSFQNPHTPYLMITLPSVFYGFFRYLQLIYTKKQGETPDIELLRDIPSLINVVLWVCLVVIALEWGT
ncbi:MAG: UbiA prenyltransferase family protein [bacterium JZ-2024 1]